MITHVITLPETYSKLIDRLTHSEFVCIPLWANFRHATSNQIIAVAVYVEDELYIVNGTHPDLPTFDLSPIFVNSGNMHVENKMDVLYYYDIPEARDLYSDMFIRTSKLETRLVDNRTAFQKSLYLRFKNYNRVNEAVPMADWIKSFEQTASQIVVSEPSNSTVFYDEVVIPALHWIESAGLAVEEHLWESVFPTIKSPGAIIYSKYNIFNNTGRPSNSNAGINFLALNKTDGSRKPFISRFGDQGTLLQFDFDSYHLRLLANACNVSVPESSLHTELAKSYFETDDITDEMYAESKQMTFSILYGNGIPQYTPRLLRQIKDFETNLWEKYQETGYLEAPVSKRKIVVPDPRKSKVFNYFVQSLEFESTIQKLNILRKRLSGFKSKVVLYTYDAVLVDCLESECGALRGIVQDTLEAPDTSGAKFPVNVYIGQNYHDLTKV